MEETHGGGHIRVKAGYPDQLIRADVLELVAAAKNLAHHVLNHGLDECDLAVGFSFLACFTAICLLILDRTNWRTNMLAVTFNSIYPLEPAICAIFFSERRIWAVDFTDCCCLQLFFPRHFPDWLEMPGALILLLEVAPEAFLSSVRDGPLGFYLCLGIACFLLQEHIQAIGGYRNTFTKGRDISNSIGIILLLVYPILCLIVYLLESIVNKF